MLGPGQPARRFFCGGVGVVGVEGGVGGQVWVGGERKGE